MCAFNATNQTPGVYIDEIKVPGPIVGVGTSTVAIVGAATNGPMYEPTLLTNPTQFQEKFCVELKDGFEEYITAPRLFATDAVYGFFENGGTMCYFVRVGTAKHASLELTDRSADPGKTTIVVTAKKEGIWGKKISVTVQDAHLATVQAARAEANLTGTGAANATAEVTEADGKKFGLGDVVLLDDGTNHENATIKDIAKGTTTFVSNLAHVYAAGTPMRVADLIVGQKGFRLASVEKIEPGSYVELSQNGTSEEKVVQDVDTQTKVITLTAGLDHPYTMAAGDTAVTVKTLEFNLIVKHKEDASVADETHDKLSMDQRHSRYFGSAVVSDLVEVALADDPANTTPAPANRPRAPQPKDLLENGEDDKPEDLNNGHYKDGIDTLNNVDEVNMLCVPDSTSQDVQQRMRVHCEKKQDRFAILDPQLNATPTNGIVTQRGWAVSENGYVALYYPRIVISNPLAAGRITIPPSGHIAGVFARTDSEKGVHKAPANEQINGVLDLEFNLTDDVHGPLNEQGINVLRHIRGRGFRIWGARTTTPKEDTQWRYVNVRRLMLFIEESIQEGTAFAVFEPNNIALWETVKRQVTDFLTRVWSTGALFGATPEEAFRVRVDEELNPPSVRALGQLIIEVVVYPTTPAEFIVFRVIQQPGGPTIEE